MTRTEFSRTSTVAMLSADDRLDRASALRSNVLSLAEALASTEARLLVLEGGDPIVSAATGSLWFPAHIRSDYTFDRELPIFLGLDRTTGAGRFADVLPSSIEQREQARTAFAAIAGAIEPPAALRSLLASGRLPTSEASAAALARSLSSWHLTVRFCGWCGEPNRTVDGGWRVRCGACDREAYPRVDPVAIMLVTDGTRCVLAHEPRFPERMFSCIAGYVEPGEDVAHAVRRETAEELGIDVETVSIVDSQPWPFPHALMIGCVAHVAAGSKLRIDTVEIEEARWFTRAEVRAMIDRKHPEGLFEPGPQAIAHHLIARFAAGD